MAEFTGGIETDYRTLWAEAGSPVPLEVCRTRYDDSIVSWEVLWHDFLWDGRGGCSSPIAEFTTWQEAQDWAQAQAATSTLFRIGRDRIIGPMPKPYGNEGV